MEPPSLQYQAGPAQCLPSGQDMWVWRVENHFQHPPRALWIPLDALLPDQCSHSVSGPGEWLTFLRISSTALSVYLGNILIFSCSLQGHTLHACQVLQWLLENKLFVKAEKCEFHVCSVSFLGYIIESEQVMTEPDKIWVVAEWPKPTFIKQLQWSLGFAHLSLPQSSSHAHTLVWFHAQPCPPTCLHFPLAQQLNAVLPQQQSCMSHAQPILHLPLNSSPVCFSTYIINIPQ